VYLKKVCVPTELIHFLIETHELSPVNALTAE